jgi:hypothetical protein
MTAVIILVALVAVMIALSSLAYGRRAGVAAGTGRGAPPSPLAVAAIGVLAAIGAIGLFYRIGSR